MLPKNHMILIYTDSKVQIRQKEWFISHVNYSGTLFHYWRDVNNGEMLHNVKKKYLNIQIWRGQRLDNLQPPEVTMSLNHGLRDVCLCCSPCGNTAFEGFSLLQERPQILQMLC